MRLATGSGARGGSEGDRDPHAGEPAIRAPGLNGEGRALILLRQIHEGLMLLDESTVAAMWGEIDAINTAALFCSTVCALQALAEYNRAEQWTQVMERLVEEHAVGPFRGWCRVHGP